jgi:hypothetical protein
MSSRRLAGTEEARGGGADEAFASDRDGTTAGELGGGARFTFDEALAAGTTAGTAGRRGAGACAGGA